MSILYNVVSAGIGLVTGMSAARGEAVGAAMSRVSGNPQNFPTLTALAGGTASQAFKTPIQPENPEFARILQMGLRSHAQEKVTNRSTKDLVFGFEQTVNDLYSNPTSMLDMATNDPQKLHSLSGRVEAARTSVLGILKGQDPRFNRVINDPANAATVGSLTTQFEGATGQLQIKNLLESFGHLTQGVQYGGNIVERMFKQNLRMSEATDGAPSVFGRTRFESAATTGKTRNGLSDAQRATLEQFEKRFKSMGVETEFRDSRDLFSIKSNIGGASKDYTYAQVRINNQSIALPLDELGHYNTGLGSVYFRSKTGDSTFGVVGKVMSINSDTGANEITTGMDYLFNPQKGAIYDMVQKVAEGKATFDDLIFSLNDRQEDAPSKVAEFLNPAGNIDLSLMRKESQIQVVDSNPKVGVEQNTLFEEHMRIAESQGYNIHAIGSHGQTSSHKYHWSKKAERSPSGTLITPATNPKFLEMYGLGQITPEGELVSHSALTRRPGRPITEPYNFSNRGSRRALDMVGGATGQMHVFQTSGPFADMEKHGLGWAIHGGFSTTKRGDDEFKRLMPEGARRNINRTAEEEARARRPAANVKIERGIRGNDPTGAKDIGLRYNPKYQELIEEVEKAQSIDPKERQKLIEKLIKDKGIEFKQGEFIGEKSTPAGVEKVFLNAAGTEEQGGIFLRDMTLGENSIGFMFERDIPFHATKAEGSTKSTEFMHPLPKADREQLAAIKTQHDAFFKTKRKEIVDEFTKKHGPKWGKDPAIKQEFQERIAQSRSFLKDEERKATEAFTKVATENEALRFVDQFNPGIGQHPEVQRAMGASTYLYEGKEIYKEDNIRLMRDQQQGATAMFTRSTLAEASGKVAPGSSKTEKFHGAMRGILNRTKDGAIRTSYTTGDTDALASFLTMAQEKLQTTGADSKHKGFKRSYNESRSQVLGLIFGNERSNALGEVLEGVRNNDKDSLAALRDLGLQDDFIDDLMVGVEESRLTWGLTHHTARDSAFDLQQGVSFERRHIEELYHAVGDSKNARHEDAKAMLESIVLGTKSVDPRYAQTLGSVTMSTASVSKESDRALDIGNKALSRADKETMFAKIKDEGGYLKFGASEQYIPSAIERENLGIIDQRGDRFVLDAKLNDMINNMLTVVESNLDSIDDEAMRQLQDLSSGVRTDLFERNMKVVNNLVEGEISGGAYRMVFVDTNEELADEYSGAIQGMGKKEISEKFNEMRSTAKSQVHKDFLTDWEARVMKGEDVIPLMQGQHPTIGPESYGFQRGYYNPAMDTTGGVSIPYRGEELKDATGKSVWTRIGGVITGKDSADYDGDTASSIAMKKALDNNENATQEEVLEMYNKLMSHVSKESLAKQYTRQKQWSQMTLMHKTSVKKSLSKIVERAPRDDVSRSEFVTEMDERVRAFMKGAGQGDVGALSNNFELLRRANRQLETNGALTREEGRRMSNYVQALEQEAVGFKHNDRSIKTVIESLIESTFTQEDPRMGTDRMFELFDQLGFKLGARTEEQTSAFVATMADLNVTKTSVVASRASDKVKPAAVVGNLLSGAVNAARSLLEVQGSVGESAAMSAVSALPDHQRDAVKREMQEAMTATGNAAAGSAASGGTGDTLSGLNSATMKAAVGKTREDALRRESSNIKDAISALKTNKFARAGLIGAGAMAGAYAIFNKGYDDEPLADIPPPPPGRAGMNGMADMPSVTGGGSRFFSESQSREGIDAAAAHGNVEYQDGSMLGPTGIITKSYSDGATHRVSSRAITLDRMSPGEYARAVQGALPNSNINVSINTTHKMPSDIERRM